MSILFFRDNKYNSIFNIINVIKRKNMKNL